MSQLQRKYVCEKYIEELSWVWIVWWDCWWES